MELGLNIHAKFIIARHVPVLALADRPGLRRCGMARFAARWPRGLGRRWRRRSSTVRRHPNAHIHIGPEIPAGGAAHTGVPLGKVIEGEVAKLVHDALAGIAPRDLVEGVAVVHHARLDAVGRLHPAARRRPGRGLIAAGICQLDVDAVRVADLNPGTVPLH